MTNIIRLLGECPHLAAHHQLWDIRAHDLTLWPSVFLKEEGSSAELTWQVVQEREREREYGSYAKSKQRIFLGLGQPFNLPMASMKTLLNYILNPSKRCCHLLRAHMASANISETLILIPFDTCSVLECVCVLNSIAAFTYTPALRSHTVSLAQSLDEELLLELKVLLLLLWFYLKYPCWEWENMAS